MHAKSPSDGSAFELNYNIEVTLEEEGEYEIHYFVLMYCSENDCDQAEDFIQFSTNIKSLPPDEQISNFIKLDNIAAQNKWIKQTSYIIKKDTDKSILKVKTNLNQEQ